MKRETPTTLGIMQSLSNTVRHAFSLLLVVAIVTMSANSANARFISPDDMDPTLPGVGTNRYAYAGNDPVNKSDPNGHIWGAVGAFIGGLLGGLLGGTTEANAPGHYDTPHSTSDSQQMRNMALGVAAGIKTATAAQELSRAYVKRKTEIELEKSAAASFAAENLDLDTVVEVPSDNQTLDVPPETKKHRNTLDDRPATLYEKYDRHNAFEKYGITHHEDANKRYSKGQIDGGRIEATDRGSRINMSKKERDLVETNPGPLNREPWAGRRKGGPT